MDGLGLQLASKVLVSLTHCVALSVRHFLTVEFLGVARTGLIHAYYHGYDSIFPYL